MRDIKWYIPDDPPSFPNYSVWGCIMHVINVHVMNAIHVKHIYTYILYPFVVIIISITILLIIIINMHFLYSSCCVLNVFYCLIDLSCWVLNVFYCVSAFIANLLTTEQLVYYSQGALDIYLSSVRANDRHRRWWRLVLPGGACKYDPRSHSGVSFSRASADRAIYTPT